MKDRPRPPTTEELLANLNNALPWSEDAERAVLGCLLNNPRFCEEAPYQMVFYHVHHQTIAGAILGLHASGKPVDIITVTRQLRESGKLEEVGGAFVISTLSSEAAIPAHFQHYVGIMNEKYNLRKMIGAMAFGIAYLQDFTGEDGQTAADALAAIQTHVCEAVNDDGSPDIPCREIKDVVNDVIDRLEVAMNGDGSISGISTGIYQLDSHLGGLEPGRLTVIAGESGDGKSSLTRQMIEFGCSQGHAGVIYTYETTDVEEVKRMFCSQGSIDSMNLKRGLLTRAEVDMFARTQKTILGWDIAVVDVAGFTIEQICRDIARRSKRLKDGKKMLVSIDYIQLALTSTSTNGGNRERQVAHITATAKQCAKMTKAHIIMPSQVNDDGKVRESRAIKNDSDNMIFIEKLTKPKSDAPAWKKKEDQPEEVDNRRNLYLDKVRDGEPKKRIPIIFEGKHFRFRHMPGNES